MNTIEDKPEMYTRLTIVLFSVFGSAFFGAFLYAYNAKLVNEKNKAYVPIVFGLLYNGIVFNTLRKLELGAEYFFFPVNLIGGLILAYVFWNEQIPKDFDFKSKGILVPLIIMIVLYGFIIAGNIWIS